jgi:hypothetical protein
MVVVVRDRGQVGIILLVISLLSLISLVVIIFLIMQGRGNVMVVAIPGFPREAMLLGLVVGMVVVVARRSPRRKHT